MDQEIGKKMKHLNNYINRQTSCLTQSSRFQSLAIIENCPVFFGVTSEKEEDDLYANMEWFLEESTGLIQLNQLIPLDILYQSQHAYGFGETWEKHYQSFSKFFLEAKPQYVLEIGGGQGRIAQICTESESIKKWTIIEPNPTIEEKHKIKVIQGFFDKNFNIDSHFDTYTFSHVLEHAYDPSEFLDHIYQKMKIGDDLIFAYPNLSEWLRNKNPSSLNFEHTIFLTEKHLHTLLINLGFQIIRKIDYLNHSHFFHVKKSVKPKSQLEYENISEESTMYLLEFLQYYKNEVAHLNKFLDENSERPIFLFGAHIFSQYLKIFGLNVDNVISVLDNSKQKHGLRLYGTNLTVDSPEVLAKYNNPIVILRAGHYNDEIRNQILSEINPDVTFV